MREGKVARPRLVAGRVGTAGIGTARSVAVVVIVVAVAAVTAALLIAGCMGDGPDASTTASSVVADALSEDRPPAPAADTDVAIWPFVPGTTRFADPVAAATSFAVSYVGFVDPVVGEFRPAPDGRSGEVPVRAHRGGPITSVAVRRVSADASWWVLGASTPNLQLDTPSALATITSPVALSGRSATFKPTVNVQIRQDDSLVPLMEGLVEGGANGQMAPFSTSLGFPQADVRGGAIVLKKYSAADGNIAIATVVRVYFASVASAHPAFDNGATRRPVPDDADGP